MGDQDNAASAEDADNAMHIIWVKKDVDRMSRRGQGGVRRTKTTSRSAPMAHGISIDAYMDKGPKSELVVLGRTRIRVPEIPNIAHGPGRKGELGCCVV